VLLSKGKGDSYDEICIFGADDMVLGLCNHRYLLYGTGSVCTLANGFEIPSIELF